MKRYYVEFIVPMKEQDVQRGFYVYKTNSLPHALKFAKNEATCLVCPGALFQVVEPAEASIVAEFPVH